VVLLGVGGCAPQGPAGPQGPLGDVGPAGAEGPAGPQGPTGSQGPAGSAGANGLSCWDLDGNGACDTGTEDVNGDGACGAQDCQGPAGATGAAGTTGPAGLACWDLNRNGACDPDTEDKNADGACDVLDCRGPQGEQGPQGVPGDIGPQGVPGDIGPQGSPGVAGSGGLDCWDTNGDHACDNGEDLDGSGTCDAADCQANVAQLLDSGVLTAPTVQAYQNVTSIQATPALWFRIGNIVHVSGTLGGISTRPGDKIAFIEVPIQRSTAFGANDVFGVASGMSNASSTSSPTDAVGYQTRGASPSAAEVEVRWYDAASSGTGTDVSYTYTYVLD